MADFAEGNLRRCEHGVYDPHGDRKYCSVCTPIVPGPEGGHLFYRAEEVLADHGLALSQLYGDAGGCPKCHSPYHYGAGDSWNCADCGKAYSAREEES